MDLKLIQLIIVLILFSIGIAIFLNKYTNENKYANEKYRSITIAIYFALAIIASSFIFNIYSKTVIPFINNNLNFIMVLVGMLVIYTGFRFIFESKNKNNRMNSKSLKIKIKNNLSLYLLFISSYLAISVNTIYVAPIIWSSIFELGMICSIGSFILIISLYLILNYLKKLKKVKELKIKSKKINSYGLAGFYIILMGIFYLIIYMFIPKFQSALIMGMSTLNLPEINIFIYMMIILIITIITGFFMKKSEKLKNLI
ncbi:MAG: DUF2162 family putative transporter [Methanobrevibacter sp.]|jgi:predicted transporter|nr:DUF2162 family putative transporter [Methanobrevibacter sp.]